MGSLLDIAPSTATVTVQKVAVPISGVSVLGIADLMRRFPKIKALFLGGDAEIGAETLLEMGPAVVAAVIAAGTGYPGDKDHEAVATRLNFMDQARLVSEILKQTFPDGVGKAVALLSEMAASAGLTLPDSPSPSIISSPPATPTPSPTRPGK